MASNKSDLQSQVMESDFNNNDFIDKWAVQDSKQYYKE